MMANCDRFVSNMLKCFGSFDHFPILQSRFISREQKSVPKIIINDTVHLFL